MLSSLPESLEACSGFVRIADSVSMVFRVVC